MKLVHLKQLIPTSKAFANVLETLSDLISDWRNHKLSLSIFLALCFNLVLAPLVLAATDGSFSRNQAWSLSLLGLVTLALAIYLFFVMFVPERF